jgi:hypothetical protein
LVLPGREGKTVVASTIACRRKDHDVFPGGIYDGTAYGLEVWGTSWEPK